MFEAPAYDTCTCRRVRQLGMQHLHQLLIALCTYQQWTLPLRSTSICRGEHLSNLPEVSYVAPALTMEYVATAASCVAPASVLKYITSGTSHVAVAPVVGHIAPVLAADASVCAQTLFVEQIAPGHAVSCGAPAPWDEYIAPSPPWWVRSTSTCR